MVFIQADNTGLVTFVHYVPFDPVNGLGKTAEELEQEGILVEFIPDANAPAGKDAVMKVDLTTKEVFYEYVDRPETSEEKVERLEQQLIMTTALLNSLLFPAE